MAESELVKKAQATKRALAKQIKLGRKKGNKSFDSAVKNATAAEKAAKKSRQSRMGRKPKK